MGVYPAEGYKGLGWQFGDYKIYQKVFNENLCLKGANYDMCVGDYGLITEAYIDNPAGDAQCLLPHTVIKHTLYFHCDSTIESQVIDSLSWVYDNTRGKMNEYPFIISEGQDFSVINNQYLDVCFRPIFHDYPIPNYIPYYIPLTNNVDYYNSGISDSSGSINYFPQSEVFPTWDICSNYQLYYDASAPPDSLDPPSHLSYHSLNYFYSDYVHPPPFSLLNAPLLNFRAREYAGYFSTGITQIGNQHTYTIDEAFDLSIINPSEKIIYNPSEVTISCDLTFPCFYQFLTLHGKYPDKQELYDSDDFSPEYWDQVQGFDFEYDRDYPIPVNCSTNTECKSTYILDGSTLTFEPNIIIMDAKFIGVSGKANYIYYNPNLTHGNWTCDTSTVTLVEDYGDYSHCTIYNQDASEKNLVNDESIQIKDNKYISILSSGTTNPMIKVLYDQSDEIDLMVYDIFANEILKQDINMDCDVISCDGLKRGVYIVILKKGEEIIEKVTFSKM